MFGHETQMPVDCLYFVIVYLYTPVEGCSLNEPLRGTSQFYFILLLLYRYLGLLHSILFYFILFTPFDSTSKVYCSLFTTAREIGPETVRLLSSKNHLLIAPIQIPVIKFVRSVCTGIPLNHFHHDQSEIALIDARAQDC